MSTFTFLLSIYRQYWGRILLSGAMQWLAAVCIFALLPFVTKQLLDQAIATKHMPFIPMCCFVGIEILIPIFFRASDWIWLHYQPLMRHRVAEHLLDRMEQHSLRFFHNQFSGNLSSKLQDALTAVNDILTTILFDFSFSLFGVVAAVWAVYSSNFWFAIILCVWVTTFFMIPILTLSAAIRLSRKMSESGAQILGHVVDVINNLLTVKLFTGYSRERILLSKYQEKFTKKSYQIDRFLWIVNVLQALSFVIYVIVYMFLLARWYPQGLITPGDFVLVVSTNTGLIPMLWNTAQKIRDVSKKYSALKQAVSSIMIASDITDEKNAQQLIVKKGTVVFNQVKFNHIRSDHEVLFDDLSLTIPGGQKVGLVGYSGGGKTTFINLLLRLFDIKQGTILIDNQDIKKVTQDSLRSHISLIPQDPTLFHRSLLENIRYGKPEASDKDVEKAAKKAHIHDFIISLPEMYDTEVGERGLKLSGGQRQRIAIARALLKDAPIIVMDEATSQLDSLTERNIHDDAFQYMKGKTVIVIAHRLSTLQQMDKILVFEAGKIIQDGTHEQLLKQKGLYKNLWESQHHL